MDFYKKLMCFFLVFIFILIFTSSSFCATEIIDVESEIIEESRRTEARFVALCYYPFINNTSTWTDSLLPLFNTFINNNYCSFIQTIADSSGTSRGFNIMLYYPGQSYDITTTNFTSRLDGSIHEIQTSVYTNTPSGTYKRLYFYPSNNTFSLSNVAGAIIRYPRCAYTYRSDLFSNFLMDIKNNSVNYSNYLNAIQTTLSDIETVNEETLSVLNTISSNLSNLNIPNYSSQISGVSSQISQIMQDNQTLISQNADMLQEQEEINNNLETLNDNLMNDNFDNSNLNLPTNNTQNSADSGINNIFSSMYNAFCTGVAQDIILPIPFTNKSIIVEPDFLYNALYNSNANWLILFIQAFWGYLIGRFIVLDVNDKFNKIKSGNIENIENSNIKGDLL